MKCFNWPMLAIIIIGFTMDSLAAVLLIVDPLRRIRLSMDRLRIPLGGGFIGGSKSADRPPKFGTSSPLEFLTSQLHPR